MPATASSVNEHYTMSSPSSSKKNLPPKRQEPAMRPVKPPLSTVSFSNFIYVLVALLALTAAYFSYRTLQIKTEVRASTT